MRSLRIVALVGVASVALLACGDDDTRVQRPGGHHQRGAGDEHDGGVDDDRAATSTTAASIADALRGKTFVSTAVEGYTLVPDTQITLTFDGDNLSAQGGCNTLAGTWSRRGRRARGAADGPHDDGVRAVDADGPGDLARRRAHVAPDRRRRRRHADDHRGRGHRDAAGRGGRRPRPPAGGHDVDGRVADQRPGGLVDPGRGAPADAAPRRRRGRRRHRLQHRSRDVHASPATPSRSGRSRRRAWRASIPTASRSSRPCSRC